MKIVFVGVGVAGIISSIAFALFPLGGWPPLEAGDFFDTLILLGITFGAVLFVGFASGSNKLSNPDRTRVVAGFGWRKKCPRCSKIVTRRTSFCPNCGANLNNTITIHPA